MLPDEQRELVAHSILMGGTDYLFKPLQSRNILMTLDKAFKVRNTNLNSLKVVEIPNCSHGKNQTLIGNSPQFVAAVDVANRVAQSMASILILGESGTGKELFANYIHKNSKRKKGPFIAINCSSIPENLLESELFGHSKGSFTGAIEKRIGIFEAAENGTLFLDEIGDLSLSLQAKLLRVLQEKKIKRVGENIDIPINCRIISATHKDLANEVKENRFREDLYFRINVIPITIPPLRDRKEDLFCLTESFLKKSSIANETELKFFSKDAIDFLMNYNWRGNVRELENAVERAVVLSLDQEISAKDFMPLELSRLDDNSNERTFGDYKISSFRNLEADDSAFHLECTKHLPSLNDVINKYISFAIGKNGGARDKTAREIGIDRKTLYKRMMLTNTKSAV